MQKQKIFLKVKKQPFRYKYNAKNHPHIRWFFVLIIVITLLPKGVIVGLSQSFSLDFLNCNDVIYNNFHYARFNFSMTFFATRRTVSLKLISPNFVFWAISSFKFFVKS